MRRFAGPTDWLLVLLATVACLMVSAPVGAAEESAELSTRPIDNFVLQDFQGATYSLADYADRPVVVVAFLGTQCPLASRYAPKLTRLAAQYESRKVAFLAIDSNCQDSITEMAAYARRTGLDIPWLKDPGNRVADQFQAERTPEVFVLDAERRIRYRGRIDDQYGVGYGRPVTTREDLRLAIDAVLAGRPVSKQRTEAVGCLIGRVREVDPASEVTYSNQIARILQRHCVECHRPGEIAPFSLTSYEEAAGWSEMIAEVVHEQRMPPWHASSDHGQFANARQMSDEEKSLIDAWVEHGAPRGDPAQLPPPREFVSGWRLSRPPDQIIAMRDRPFRVPAEGTVEYQYFVVDPGFKEDKWISGAEVIPGNHAVVHHAIVFFRAPEGVQQRGLGWLTAYVPGQSSFEAAPQQARRVPAGSKLIFQMHYTTNGSPQEDLTRVGILLADESSVREELLTVAALNHDLEIPPQAADYEVQATRSDFPAGARLLAIAPHMHVRGRAFRVELTGSQHDGERSILLDVPHYDFNWQHAYQLAEPLPLDRSAQIVCTARFDNSDANLVNPDPTAVVRWGDQTWEEMMIAFLEIAVPFDPDASQQTSGDRPLEPGQQRQAEAAAESFIRRFDRDGDGSVQKKETPEAFAIFAFGRVDRDGNDVISPDEALEEAIRSQRRKASRGGL